MYTPFCPNLFTHRKDSEVVIFPPSLECFIVLQYKQRPSSQIHFKLACSLFNDIKITQQSLKNFSANIIKAQIVFTRLLLVSEWIVIYLSYERLFCCVFLKTMLQIQKCMRIKNGIKHCVPAVFTSLFIFVPY